MKIRQDFVTNSSSVSYIVTFCPSLYNSVDNCLWAGHEEKIKIKYSRIEDLLKNDLYESGTRAYLEGSELYVKKYQFDTNDVITDNEYEKLDFSTLTDDDLWKYILGQFLGMGELGKVWGFGVTQVETF